MLMKKWILLTAVTFLVLPMMAQDDDMYFVPTKENLAKEAESYGMPKNTYYSGSKRSIDDYNRRTWSSAVPIDSAGNDIIDFSAVRGVYPDSTYTDAGNDYKYTRELARFDNYVSTDAAYWEGYRDGRWSSPWYYTSYYSTWYDPWYDPWYYGGYYGYYSPWRYGWYSYYRPWTVRSAAARPTTARSPTARVVPASAVHAIAAALAVVVRTAVVAAVPAVVAVVALAGNV